MNRFGFAAMMMPANTMMCVRIIFMCGEMTVREEQPV